MTNRKRNVECCREFVLGCALFFILASIASAQSTGGDKLRDEMRKVLAEEGLVGAAWATVLPDGSIHPDAVGYRDNPMRVPFTDRTRFHVGSVAKSVLATGILRLVTEERLALDDPLSKHLPAVRIENPWSQSNPVTIRHLLDHTSGLDDLRLWQMFSTGIAPDTPLDSLVSRRGEPLRVRVRPGSRFSYSNTGYTLLGMVIEALTAMPYETYLDAHLLAPLGMHNSTFRFTTQQGPEADSTLAWGHVDDGSRYAATPVAVRPAAQFTTTAHDLALFARFLMGEGSIAGRKFIRADLMRARGFASTTEAANAGLNAGYALGLSRRDRDGVVGYCHSGNIVGFFAMVCTYPDAGSAFVVSINTDSETARYPRVLEVLFRHLQVDAVAEPPTGMPAADIHEWEGFYVLSPSRLQSFAYVDAVFGGLRLTRRNDLLILNPVQGSDRELRPTGGYLFSANDRATASHVLMRTGNEYLMSDGYSTYRKVSAWYIATLWMSLALGLLGVLWFLGAGIATLMRYRGSAWPRVEMIPFAGVLGLLVPLPFFLMQGFMRLGEMTTASVLLAAVMLALPLTMIALLWRVMRTPSRRRSWIAIVHANWALAVLQWCVVLATWGMLPLRLWT